MGMPSANSKNPSDPSAGARAKSGRAGWRTMLGALTIVAAILLIYWPTLRASGSGTTPSVLNNPLLSDPDRLWKAWFEPGSFIEYYPIEQTVQWIEWQFWGTEPMGYHVVNVVLHMVSALLVWRLLHKLGLRLAWLGALIFAFHPANVESVAWLSELKDTLSMPPFLFALLAWIDYEDRHRQRDYFITLGLFSLALLCKISMAPFCAFIPLYAWSKRGRLRVEGLRRRAAIFRDRRHLVVCLDDVRHLVPDGTYKLLPEPELTIRPSSGSHWQGSRCPRTSRSGGCR